MGRRVDDDAGHVVAGADPVHEGAEHVRVPGFPGLLLRRDVPVAPCCEAVQALLVGTLEGRAARDRRFAVLKRGRVAVDSPRRLRHGIHGSAPPLARHGVRGRLQRDVPQPVGPAALALQ